MKEVLPISETHSRTNRNPYLLVGCISLPVIILVTVALTGFGWILFDTFRNWERFDIPDATVPANLVLRCDHTPHTVNVHISGFIDGTGEISLGRHHPVTLQGKVDWEQRFDWFSSELSLNYQPIQVNKGSLSVTYKFE